MFETSACLPLFQPFKFMLSLFAQIFLVVFCWDSSLYVAWLHNISKDNEKSYNYHSFCIFMEIYVFTLSIEYIYNMKTIGKVLIQYRLTWVGCAVNLSFILQSAFWRCKEMINRFCFTCVYLLYMVMSVHALPHTCDRGQLAGLGSLFQHIESGYETWVVTIGRKHLYLLRHLTWPYLAFLC